jgi:hypothetical protein
MSEVEQLEDELEALAIENDKLREKNEKLSGRLKVALLPGIKDGKDPARRLEANEILLALAERCRNRVGSELLRSNYKDDDRIVKKVDEMKVEIAAELDKLMKPSNEMEPLAAESYRRGIEYLRMEKRRLKKLKNEFVALCNKRSDKVLEIRQAELDLLHCKQDLEVVLSKSTLKRDDVEPLIENATQQLYSHARLQRKITKYEIQRNQSATYIKNFIFSLRRVIKEERYLYDMEPLDRGAIKTIIAKRELTIMIQKATELFKKPLDSDLPAILLTTFGYLEERALKKESIFAKKDDYKEEKIRLIKQAFDDNSTVDLSACEDYFLVASLVKLYYRELNPPLLAQIQHDLLNIERDVSDERLTQHVKTCLGKIRDRMVVAELSQLMLFLHQVDQNYKHNRTKAKNLAEIFAPFLLPT